MSNKHTVYYNSDGMEVPSVTTILKILNKPALTNWANYLGFKNTKVEDVLQATSYVGTQVHKLIEDRLNNIHRFSLKNENELDAQIITGYKNFLLWYRENRDIRVIHNELKLTCDSFGGTIDLVCDRNGLIHVIDFKTSKDIFPTMFLQLAGYIHLLEYNGYNVDKVAILRLDRRKLNSFNTLTKTRKDMDKYIENFLMLKDIYINLDKIFKTEWKVNLI